MVVMDETQLINLTKNGEQDAYRKLVERYQTGLIIYCENILKDRDVAEDVAQEAFVRAYYSIRRFDETKGAFSTWLYRIAMNLTRDYVRKHRNTVTVDELESLPAKLDTLTEAEKLEIRSIVAKLQPPEYARVISAYYWEGMRYADIATELNVPVATVSTWLTRAKVKLRKELI